MKKVFWRPHKVSRVVLALIATLSIAFLSIIETRLEKVKQPRYGEKIEASRLTKDAFEVVKAYKLKRGWKPDLEADPAQTGLVGVLMSPVTTNTGHLQAKQTSVNPNFAAVIVHLLERAGVKEGDTVALGLSGSFPALNICAYAAVQTLDLFPVAISSASGSQWGANETNALWIDMERWLFEREVFTFRSVAASRGGVEDRALGLSKQGRRLIDQAIDRNDLPMIRPATYAESVEMRMKFYYENAGDAPIKAYINVGGGTTSVGTRVGKRMYEPGLNMTAPRGSLAIDSVMTRFALDGVPIIHLVSIDELAMRYGLPLQPIVTPPVGEGTIFVKEEYNDYLVVGSLVTIFALMVAFIRFDWGYRITGAAKRERKKQAPEQMV
ncbi:poly-gamma-glutamate system protein [bacterium]|nr:poly-gamma-glutamate system protein [bacterium]